MSLDPTGRNRIALAATCLAALMFGLEISSVPVILPTLERVLAASFQDLQWIMNAYTIACTPVLMATGTLADRFGRRRVFAVSIWAFAITSLICGLASSALLLIIGRFLQGMAGGAIFICSIAVLSHQFRDGAERGRAFAMWGVIAGIGLGFGPAVGGMIVALASWQWVFLVHVPLALMTLVLASAGVRESRDPAARHLDLAGIATLTVAVFCLAFYITQGPGLGFGSVASLAILAVAVLSFIAFVFVEKLNAHPMFDFSVFRVRNFSGAIIGCIGMNFSYWPLMIYLPIYFTAGLGYDSTVMGAVLLAYTMPFLVMTPVAQYLLHRHGARTVIPLGLFTIGLGFLLMRFGSSAPQASWLTMLPGALIAGMGIGLTNTPVTDTTTGSVSADRSGMASGIDVSARLIALAINIAVMGFVLVQGILAHLREALPSGIDAAGLRTLAEGIASGSVTSLADRLPGVASDGVLHGALTQGFGWITLYGGIGAWILAALAFAILSPKRKARFA
ncbi:MFS transporter [Taklimakanibacter lacteus]|uniref:MFS transporter n=1 Tax=Taklimakanibacter lacteus TaxID=2268456 RepID=UPI000E664908